jgi:flagellar biosynthesis anti-sigma factor FlgM
MVDSISGCGRGPERPVLLPVGGRDPASRATPVSPTGGDIAGARAASVGQADGGTAGLLRELSGAPPVDSGKVAALRAAIAGGTYQVDVDATAAAMIRSELGGSGA